jgi:hypothetical protein
MKVLLKRPTSFQEELMTKPRYRHLAACCGAVMLAGLSACGGGGSPSHPSSPPPPVTRVIHDDAFAVASETVVPDTFATTSTGTLEVTLDWTFASNDVDIFIARGSEPCTLATFNDRSCGFIASAESTTLKPEKVSIPNLAAGSYTLYVANFGSSDESVACHITLATASGSSAGSVSITGNYLTSTGLRGGWLSLTFTATNWNTPQFVLVANGREIGRIRGYPGEDHFWGLLGVLIKKLDSPGTGGEQELLQEKSLRTTG